MAELVWIPLYLDRLLGSPRWQSMKDFQRGWYMQLLLLCARSQRTGYLPLDGRLWEMAGAHSRAMWDQHSAAVMACFQTRTFDGTEWIYNERMLHTIDNQRVKLTKSLELRNTVKNISISGFIKPSIEEIKLYCIERKNAVNPVEFYEHYETNGWMCGRVPMKKWKSAVHTWEQRNYGGSNGRTNTNRQESTKQPSAVVARFHNNRAERERARAAVVGQAGGYGNRQETGLGAGNTHLLDGEIKKLP